MRSTTDGRRRSQISFLRRQHALATEPRSGIAQRDRPARVCELRSAQRHARHQHPVQQRPVQQSSGGRGRLLPDQRNVAAERLADVSADRLQGPGATQAPNPANRDTLSRG